jgi:hypothetical protein
MERQVKFIPPKLEQLLRLGPSERVRLGPAIKNDLSDIVTNKEELWKRSALKRLLRELRDLELEEIIRKNKPCHR